MTFENWRGGIYTNDARLFTIKPLSRKKSARKRLKEFIRIGFGHGFGITAGHRRSVVNAIL
jgi:hypothetical protein